MLKKGDQLGKWRVDRILGEGSFGAVYACTDTFTGEIQAAVKILKFGSSDDDKGRFLREVQALNDLTDDNIVRVKDWGQVPGTNHFFMAMDLIEGTSLEARMEQGPMPLDEARRVFDEALDGLEHAHKRGIFHRDLKPANIMINAEGKAVLVDFGVAIDVSNTRMTQEGMALGTPAYMGPEVFDDVDLDPVAGDIYAMGQIIVECLEGGLRFPDKSGLTGAQQMARLMKAKLDTAALDPGEGFSDALRAVLRKATDPSPAARHPSVTQLRYELNAAWDGKVAPPRDIEPAARLKLGPQPTTTPAPPPIPAIESKSGSGSKAVVIGGVLLVAGLIVAVVVVLAIAGGVWATSGSEATDSTQTAADGQGDAAAKAKGEAETETEAAGATEDATEGATDATEASTTDEESKAPAWTPKKPALHK